MPWKFDPRAAPVAETDPQKILALADRLEYAGFGVTAATLRHLVGMVDERGTSNDLEYGD